MYFNIYKNNKFIKNFKFVDLNNINIDYNDLLKRLDSIYNDFKNNYSNEYNLIISLENKGGNK